MVDCHRKSLPETQLADVLPCPKIAQLLTACKVYCEGLTPIPDEIAGILEGVTGKANQARVEKALELLRTVMASLTGEPEGVRA